MNKINYKILEKNFDGVIYDYQIELLHNDINRNAKFYVVITKYSNEMSIRFVDVKYILTSEITTLKRVVLKDLRDEKKYE